MHGGSGGLGSDSLGKQDGWGGTGVINDGWVLRSNTWFIGGHEGFETEGLANGGSGVVVDQDPHFPALRMTSDITSTGVVELRVSGEAGDGVSLLIGSRPTVNADSVWNPALRVEIEEVRYVGAIPANGMLTYSYDAPAGFAPGDLVALQAMVLTAEGYRLSNSATVVLR